MTRIALVLATVLWAAALTVARPAEAASPSALSCRTLAHDGQSYLVCEIDIRQKLLKLFWKQANGKRYGTLLNFSVKSRVRHGRMIFAMNAGMYHPDRTPVGLYVEDGSELVPLNTSAGAGNFFMKPNGVFFVDGARAGVLETGSYLEKRMRPIIATQSGPMLVIDGRVHPKFSGAGVSRNIRNGVGVRDDHTVVFAISTTRVTFDEFARFFRDQLQCQNALYLDGKVSGVYAPKLMHRNIVTPLGPIFGAFDRK